MSIPQQSTAFWRAENPYATFLFRSAAQAYNAATAMLPPSWQRVVSAPRAEANGHAPPYAA
jgi:hypothetical protein